MMELCCAAAPHARLQGCDSGPALLPIDVGCFFLFIYVLIFFQCSRDKCSLLVRVLGEEREQNGSAGVAG